MAGITKEEQKRRDELLAKGLKVCSKCGRVLPVEQFSKDKNRKDGFNNQCKECVAQYTKQYDREHKEERQQYNKQYYQETKEERQQYHQQYHQTPQGQIVSFNSRCRRRTK